MVTIGEEVRYAGEDWSVWQIWGEKAVLLPFDSEEPLMLPVEEVDDLLAKQKKKERGIFARWF